MRFAVKNNNLSFITKNYFFARGLFERLSLKNNVSLECGFKNNESSIATLLYHSNEELVYDLVNGNIHSEVCTVLMTEYKYYNLCCLLAPKISFMKIHLSNLTSVFFYSSHRFGGVRKPVIQLSKNEMTVFLTFIKGGTIKQAARKCNIRFKTAYSLKYSSFYKLNIENIKSLCGALGDAGVEMLDIKLRNNHLIK